MPSSPGCSGRANGWVDILPNEESYYGTTRLWPGLRRRFIGSSAQLLPFALLGIYYLIVSGKISFLNYSVNSSDYINIMLVLGGVITITPLLLFNGAATRMKLSTLGFFQYLGPTCAFLLAIFVYHEEFNTNKLITFGLIWVALVVFSLDSLNTKNKNKKKSKSF